MMFDMDEKFKQDRAKQRANDAYRRAAERERADAINREEMRSVGRLIIQLITIAVALYVVVQVISGLQVQCHPGLALDGNGLHVNRCATWSISGPQR